jgi:membrane protein DedA with SNARE-associated domain
MCVVSGMVGYCLGLLTLFWIGGWLKHEQTREHADKVAHNRRTYG